LGLQGGSALLSSAIISNSFDRGSKGSIVATRKLFSRITGVVLSAAPTSFAELSQLVRSALADVTKPADGSLEETWRAFQAAAAGLCGAAVRRLAFGTLEARPLVTSCLEYHASFSADAALLQATRLLPSVLASSSHDRSTFASSQRSRGNAGAQVDANAAVRARLLQKDIVVSLCLVIYAALDSGASQLHQDDCALLEVVELAGRAGPVVETLVLRAVERAWLSS